MKKKKKSNLRKLTYKTCFIKFLMFSHFPLLFTSSLSSPMNVDDHLPRVAASCPSGCSCGGTTSFCSGICASWSSYYSKRGFCDWTSSTICDWTSSTICDWTRTCSGSCDWTSSICDGTKSLRICSATCASSCEKN